MVEQEKRVEFDRPVEHKEREGGRRGRKALLLVCLSCFFSHICLFNISKSVFLHVCVMQTSYGGLGHVNKS